MNPQPFEALVVAITTQQISLHAAASIRRNLVERYGVRHDVAWEFPTRERIKELRPRHFTPLGFSRAKAEYVLELAHSDLDLDALAALDDEDVIARLTSVRGIGRWTADWFLARHLARPHAWPAGDLGVRKAVSTFYAARSLTLDRGGPCDGRALRPVPEPVRAVPARRSKDGGLDERAPCGRRRTSTRSPISGGSSTTRSRLRLTRDRPTSRRSSREVREIIDSEIAFVAEDDGAAVGFALARRRASGFGTLTDLYVANEARRSGIGTELMRQVLSAFRALEIEHFDLEVVASNHVARSLYARWGFRDDVIVMTGSVSGLEERLGAQETSSFGSIHLQSDDLSAVEQAVRQFVPRLPGGSRGSVVAPPRGGWIAVYDDVCDRNPEMLRRLARELSDRIGAVTLLLGLEREELVRMILFERGRIVDEYLSVPEFYGPLPPGDVIGLAANPTVMSRLTGADPEAVRRIARTAPSPADLPPARELLAELAGVMHVEGAGTGWADAQEIDGSVRIER